MYIYIYMYIYTRVNPCIKCTGVVPHHSAVGSSWLNVKFFRLGAAWQSKLHSARFELVYFRTQLGLCLRVCWWQAGWQPPAMGGVSSD